MLTFALLLILSEVHRAAILACPRLKDIDESGTGVLFAVRDGNAYLLTASHVAKYNGVTVQFPSRDKNPKSDWFPERPTVIARWQNPDLALVRFPIGKHRVRPIPLAAPDQRPKPSELPVDVWAIGVGSGTVATVRTDRLRAKQFTTRPGEKQPAFFWETDGPSKPGDSGGPLLDQKGRIIGICVANVDGHGYYAHLDEILAALRKSGYGKLIDPN